MRRLRRASSPAHSPSRAIWVASATLTVSAIVFLKTLDSVTELGTTLRADRSLLDVVITHRSAWLTDIARLCTSLGSAWIVAPVTTVAVLILTARRRIGMAAILAASTIGTALAVSLAKALVARPRPPIGGHLVDALGAAFPSGHAAQSVACYAALAWIITTITSSAAIRLAAWSVAVILALGVGWSRVYLGVHWPSDVSAAGLSPQPCSPPSSSLRSSSPTGNHGLETAPSVDPLSRVTVMLRRLRSPQPGRYITLARCTFLNRSSRPFVAQIALRHAHLNAFTSLRAVRAGAAAKHNEGVAHG